MENFFLNTVNVFLNGSEKYTPVLYRYTIINIFILYIFLIIFLYFLY